MPVDLLVFGPHPDDIEIGLGGTVARQAADGIRVGLCDLTAGEMGSNGTVEERLAEAEAARLVLGAVWRHNLRWPDRRIGSDPAHIEEAVGVHPASPAAHGRDSLLGGPSSGSRRGERAAHRGRLQRRAEALRSVERSVEARVDLLLLHQRLGRAVVRGRRERDYYDQKRAALDCHASQFQAPSDRVRVATRLNTPLFRQLIESRDAQFGARPASAGRRGSWCASRCVRPDRAPAQVLPSEVEPRGD